MTDQPPFSWPGGKRCAVSISFDDARASQLELGVPILDAYGVRGTFYVSFEAFEKRLDGWRRAAESGHEIGNHTVSHPCSGNFGWPGQTMLERLTLSEMERELSEASDRIERLIGRRPATFAYPCGQKFVGRGVDLHSYVPLVARHFLAGRGFRDESFNHPAMCDLAQVCGTDADGASAEQLTAWAQSAAARGSWLVLVAHDVSETAGQAISPTALEAFCAHAKQAESGVWTDTVEVVARYLESSRGLPTP